MQPSSSHKCKWTYQTSPPHLTESLSSFFSLDPTNPPKSNKRIWCLVAVHVRVSGLVCLLCLSTIIVHQPHICMYTLPLSLSLSLSRVLLSWIGQKFLYQNEINLDMNGISSSINFSENRWERDKEVAVSVAMSWHLPIEGMRRGKHQQL